MSLNTWWTAWGALVGRLVALFSSFASMVGLLIAFIPTNAVWPWWTITLLILAGSAFVILVALECLDRRRRHVYDKSDAPAIRRYMHDWIEHGGRVAIWTRDMSWANNPDTRRLLTEKARRKELVLCLPAHNEFTTALVHGGAEVCVYGTSLLESPSSRFTIALLGRDGSRVAVGRAEGNTHVIDEFNANDHPAFHLAADLIAIVRAFQRTQST
jgi:hypothetical protein